jgi:hypothetical protein
MEEVSSLSFETETEESFNEEDSESSLTDIPVSRYCRVVNDHATRSGWYSGQPVVHPPPPPDPR